MPGRDRRGDRPAPHHRREIARAGGTPLAVATRRQAARRDLPQGYRQGRHPRAIRRAARKMGIRTVMITGDNPLTAAAIAAEAGVDDFLAQATPEDKLALIRKEQQGGKLVGDVRRRHQRRPRAGAGRCRRRDEHRHAGRARGGQYGRSRQRSDQADRDRRPRQAAADDARGADHLLGRQRRRQIFRDHPGDVHRALPRAGHPQRHASGDPAPARSSRRSSSMR